MVYRVFLDTLLEIAIEVKKQCSYSIKVRLKNSVDNVFLAYSCIFVQNITKAGFQYKPRIFFYFCDLDFIDFFEIFGGIHEYLAINLEAKVVFMKCEKK